MVVCLSMSLTFGTAHHLLLFFFPFASSKMITCICAKDWGGCPNVTQAYDVHCGVDLLSATDGD